MARAALPPLFMSRPAPQLTSRAPGTGSARSASKGTMKEFLKTFVTWMLIFVVVLTPAGQRLQLQLQQAFALIATASAEVQMNATREPATLRLTVLPSVYQYFLADRLPQFRQLHPDIKVTVVPTMAAAPR